MLRMVPLPIWRWGGKSRPAPGGALGAVLEQDSLRRQLGPDAVGLAEVLRLLRLGPAVDAELDFLGAEPEAAGFLPQARVDPVRRRRLAALEPLDRILLQK